MDVLFGDESRGRPLIVSGGKTVSFSDSGKVLFTADPHLLIGAIVEAVAPHDQKMKKLKTNMMRGFA